MSFQELNISLMHLVRNNGFSHLEKNIGNKLKNSICNF